MQVEKIKDYRNTYVPIQNVFTTFLNEDMNDNYYINFSCDSFIY